MRTNSIVSLWRFTDHWNWCCSKCWCKLNSASFSFFLLLPTTWYEHFLWSWQSLECLIPMVERLRRLVDQIDELGAQHSAQYGDVFARYVNLSKAEMCLHDMQTSARHGHEERNYAAWRRPQFLKSACMTPSKFTSNQLRSLKKLLGAPTNVTWFKVVPRLFTSHPHSYNNDLQTTLWVTQRCFYSFQTFRRSTPSSVK